MDDLSTKELISKNKLIPYKAALFYAVISCLWILGSDHLISFLTDDFKTLSKLQTYKGWFFVLITTIYIFVLISRNLKLLVKHQQDTITRQTLERTVSEVFQGITAQTGFAFFNALVLQLTKTLNVDYVLIGSLNPEQPDKIKTVAMAVRGQISENIEYDLIGTPCETVINGSICSYDTGITEIFPQDKMLHEFGLDSYIGTPLLDSAGQVLGLMVAMDSKPLKDKKMAETLFSIFALRAAAEMERIKSEKKLNYLAFHDSLTDLPNRALLNNRLSLALERGNANKQKLAILYLDVDDFKLVNDSLGHAMGDVLLKEIAQRLKGCLAEGNTVARMGGDEFTIILPDIQDEDVAANMAQKVIAAVSQPQFISGREINITASIGITIFPTDGRDVEKLLKNADIAMYSAKSAGRNNYQFYSKEMTEATQARMNLEQDLRKAIKNNELELYYQPKVNANNNSIVGMEALIRWQHPEDGLLMPNYFIPIAESTGLIIPMGEWVMTEACRQNKYWQETGLSRVRVAVNISARQFYQNDFVATVANVLEKTGLEPHWLELEITESIAILDIDQAIKVLKELRDMGIYIAIDDFGTGYSALNYLKQFPVNTLKIDRCFIKDIHSSPDDSAITNAIITMGQSLNLEVIAEGVETEEQSSYLKQCKCDLMQGYLFGKPMPSKEFEALLTNPKLNL